jgi:hypothetical protein
VNPGKTRPIKACFNDYQIVEHILYRAYKLKGKYNFGNNGDYPKETVKARSRIWPKYKEEQSKNAPKSAYVCYSAKMIVKNRVQDEFPRWQNVNMQISRYKERTSAKGDIITKQHDTLNIQRKENHVLMGNPFSALSEMLTDDNYISDNETDNVDKFNQSKCDYKSQQKDVLHRRGIPCLSQTRIRQLILRLTTTPRGLG